MTETLSDRLQSALLPSTATANTPAAGDLQRWTVENTRPSKIADIQHWLSSTPLSPTAANGRKSARQQQNSRGLDKQFSRQLVGLLAQRSLLDIEESGVQAMAGGKLDTCAIKFENMTTVLNNSRGNAEAGG